MMRLLIADVVSGRRAPGEMLPREVDLAAEYGVSRGVARECIRAMEERGLISVRHGRGATIADSRSWDVIDPDVLAAVLDGDGGNALLAEYLECRRIIEVEAAGLAAERASAEALALAGEALDRMEQSAAHSGPAAEQRFHEADVSFHQALIRAAGNRPMADIAERIHAGLVVARFPLARPQYRQERALPEHRRILDAVASGDAPGARRAMSDHLDTIAGYLAERAAEPR
jgi:GntR family transcriptional repressor for pyruvate dehydrogenase complex